MTASMAGRPLTAAVALLLFCGGEPGGDDRARSGTGGDTLAADTASAHAGRSRGGDASGVDADEDLRAIHSIRVAPSSATIRADGRLRLQATLDPPGPGAEAIRWTTSNAAVAVVDDSGMVHGVAPGSATIRAAVDGREGTAAIRVTAARSAVATTSAAAGESREPTGYVEITDRSFAARDDAGWSFNRSSHYDVVIDSTAPGACCTVARATYQRGRSGGDSPATTWYRFASDGYTELYLSFWLKLSDNWQGHRSGVNKIGFVWIHGDASVYFSAQGGGSGPLRPEIRLQAVPGGARNLVPNRNHRRVERGRWHHWEVQLVSNAGGRPDGVARLWLDGVPVADYRDVRFASARQERSWESVYWMPIWGGVGDVVRNDMYMLIDRFYASGR
jgi:hypothetical protein